ncbi:hypothetical protein BX600DRAFT_149627 [Xylariales sp. PMI_506]|nr:hypothetical protein BX600DRAFT_149627 [Xylariales sp. PMI_506]
MACLTPFTLVSLLALLPYVHVLASPSTPRRSPNVLSPDGHCGGINGYTCLGSPAGNCCSPCGSCGNAEKHCGSGCQPAFGMCSIPSPSAIESSATTSVFLSTVSGISSVEATTSATVTTITVSTPTNSDNDLSSASSPTQSPATTLPPSSSSAAGSAQYTDPSSCPVAQPTGTVQYESNSADAAVAHFSYQIYEGSSPSSGVQILVTLNGTTILFDFSNSNAITGTFADGSSFTLTAQGTFSYVAPGCGFGIDGTLNPGPTNQRERRTEIGRRDTLGTAAVTINVFNLCGQPDPGKSVNIQCASNNYLSNHNQLTDAGNGAYTGSCAFEYLDSTLCQTANQICVSDIASQISSTDIAASCNTIADVASQAALPGTEDDVTASVLAACTSVLDIVGSDLCGSYLSDASQAGTNCQVLPLIDVYMYAEAIDGVPGHTVTNSQVTVARTGAPAVSATLTVGGSCTTST